MDLTDRALGLLIAVAAAAAIFLGIGRIEIERANRTVELIVDADDVRQVAVAAGLSFRETLARLREAGATALAVRELTVEDLIRTGRVLATGHPNGTVLAPTDREVASLVRLGDALEARLPGISLGVSAYTPALVLEDLSLDQIWDMPVMLRPEDVAAARAAGLRVVARPVNWSSARPEEIRAALSEARRAGARLVIFRDDEVLGHPRRLDVTAEAIRQHDLLFGFVEMAAQKGDEPLARLLPDHLIRVHSMTEGDLASATPAAAVVRYLRAVRERGVRACYVRLFSPPGREPMEANSAYLADLASRLQRAGFRLGPPGPLSVPDGWPPLLPRAVAALAVPAACLLLLRRLLPLPARWTWLAFAVFIGVGLVLYQWHSSVIAPLAGLAVACVFPGLSIVLVFQRCRDRRLTSLPATLGHAITSLALACLISLAGGLVIAALFSRGPYLVGAARFVGVKLAYLAPLPIVLFAVIADLPGGAEAAALWWARVRLRIGDFCRRPLVMLEAGMALLALAAVAFALMRSGNESAVPPSALELRLREMLESVLFVRPRTKEFLIGHPALMLLAALTLRQRLRWLPLVALLATVGQISLVNTFCHFHSPLLVSLLRTAHGFWMGAAAGALVVCAWWLLWVRRPARTP